MWGQDRIGLGGESEEELEGGRGLLGVKKGLQSVGIVGASGWGSSKGDEDSGSPKWRRGGQEGIVESEEEWED